MEGGSYWHRGHVLVEDGPVVLGRKPDARIVIVKHVLCCHVRREEDKRVVIAVCLIVIQRCPVRLDICSFCSVNSGTLNNMLQDDYIEGCASWDWRLILIEDVPFAIVVPDTDWMGVICATGATGIPVRRDKQDCAGLIIAIRPVNGAVVFCAVGRRGGVHEDIIIIGLGQRVDIEGGSYWHGSPVLVEDGPPAIVVPDADWMGVVHTHSATRVPVRCHEDDGLRIVIRDAIVQVGPVIRDIGCARGMYVDDGPASALRMCSDLRCCESCGSREQCDKDKRKDEEFLKWFSIEHMAGAISSALCGTLKVYFVARGKALKWFTKSSCLGNRIFVFLAVNARSSYFQIRVPRWGFCWCPAHGLYHLVAAGRTLVARNSMRIWLRETNAQYELMREIY